LCLFFFGAESGEFIETVSDLGVTLLLFTIGLKLKIKNLLRHEVYGGALIHMLIITVIFAEAGSGLADHICKTFSNS